MLNKLKVFLLAIIILGSMGTNSQDDEFYFDEEEGNEEVEEVRTYTHIDIYDFKMSLHVPRIYDNSLSQGYRKYQRQILRGKLLVKFYKEGIRPEIQIVDLINKTHKVGKANVTYNVTVDEGTYEYPRWNFIGNNKKNSFKKVSIMFYIIAEPSYNIGNINEDNTLMVEVAGCGSTLVSNNRRIAKVVRGAVSGKIGCGCSAYGHMSPTRVGGAYGATEIVDDVAAVYGTFYLKYNRKLSNGR